MMTPDVRLASGRAVDVGGCVSESASGSACSAHRNGFRGAFRGGGEGKDAPRKREY